MAVRIVAERIGPRREIWLTSASWWTRVRRQGHPLLERPSAQPPLLLVAVGLGETADTDLTATAIRISRSTGCPLPLLFVCR
jgi:hypothetical protein